MEELKATLDINKLKLRISRMKRNIDCAENIAQKTEENCRKQVRICQNEEQDIFVCSPVSQDNKKMEEMTEEKHDISVMNDYTSSQMPEKELMSPKNEANASRTMNKKIAHDFVKAYSSKHVDVLNGESTRNHQSDGDTKPSCVVDITVARNPTKIILIDEQNEGNIMPVRRSGRAVCKSHVLRSNDFLCHLNAFRHTSLNSYGPNTRKLQGNFQSTVSIFPEFPMYSSICLKDDFALPDSEFADLKSQLIEKQKKQCHRDSISDGTHSFSSESIKLNKEEAIIFPAECNPHEDSEKKTWTKCQITTLPNERVRMINCGQFRCKDKVVLFVVIVQTSVISTFTSTNNIGDQWILLEEHYLDTRKCTKSCLACLEIETCLASVCIGSDCDLLPTMWIHICNSDGNVHFEKLTLTTAIDQSDLQAILCCSNDVNMIFCAQVASRKSFVTRYTLNASLIAIQSEVDFLEVCDNVNSIVVVDGFEMGLLGLSSSKLYLWNTTNGHLIKVIEPQEATFTFSMCTFCMADKGLLFLGTLNVKHKHDWNLIVINPLTSSWSVLTQYPVDLVPTVFKQRQTRGRRHILKEAKKRGQYLIMVGGVVSLWNLSTGKLLGYLDDRNVTTATLFQQSTRIGPTIVTADNYGTVTMYATS